MGGRNFAWDHLTGKNSPTEAILRQGSPVRSYTTLSLHVFENPGKAKELSLRKVWKGQLRGLTL